MTSRTAWFLATILGLIRLEVASPQSPPPPAESPDEARERQAMSRFLAVLEKSPRRGTALDRVYGYHVERGSLDAFLQTYRDRLAADPRDGLSALLIGLIEAQRGRDSAAVEAFRLAEAARADDPLPPYLLGQALVLVGQPDLAAQAFERALTRKPARADLLEVYQSLGRVHQRAHREAQALAVWDRLEKAFPDDPRVQEQIAQALLDEGRDAPALARFETLAKSTRDRFRQVQFALEAASLKVKLGRGPEALADFEALLSQLDPASWLHREVRRKVEEVFLRTDDLAGMAAYYERWVARTPDDVDAMSRLSRTLASLGRSAEARNWLEKATRLAPSRRELRLAWIEQLVQDRDFARAAAQYEALAQQEPGNPDVVRDWGRMLLRDTTRPEAVRQQAAARVWQALAPEGSTDPVAIARLADLYRQAGMTDPAIASYARAIDLAPESPQYREYLGEYYHTLKRPADALKTWRGSVVGKPPTARSLSRLGEVLAGFGYRPEAVEPVSAAVRLEPEDLDLRLQLADLRLALDRPLEALSELEKAEALANSPEAADLVLDRFIKASQVAGILPDRIQTLQGALTTHPSAAGYTRLARLLEADQKPAEAARAIGEATRLDPKSVPAWVATARLLESAGDFLGAANALRALVALDRRSRTDSLMGIARLEARLGRRGPALEAGRELLAAAPGQPDVHRFFADLCFQLGETDEGLDALRRSARTNPSDPKATLTLAENLARASRIEEAIELFWRGFARTSDLEGKLAIVSRLTEQYLARNQFDRLISRLERELREPAQQREKSLCLAQAYAASGDNGTARQELERLLASNARDVPLLVQLSNLAEQEGDLSAAARYQAQALETAPNPEGTTRLAQLYLRAGEYLEAESIWTRSTETDQDPTRALVAIDSLLASGKREASLLIAGRLLRNRPGDWELIYREAVALAGLNRPGEADERFRVLLSLKFGDDEPGLLARAKSGASSTNPSSRPAGLVAGSPFKAVNLPIQERVASAARARVASGVDGNLNPGNGLQVPLDFGQARVFALAWRWSLARRENRQEAFFQSQREATRQAPEDPRTAWEWYYLQQVRMIPSETFEAARGVVTASPNDLAAQWAFLGSLGARTVGPDQQRIVRAPGSTAPDLIPALPSADVDRVLTCFEGLRARRGDLAPATLADVLAELKRANRTEDGDKLYRQAMTELAPGSASATLLVNLAAERGDFEGLTAFLDKVERSPATPLPNGTMGSAWTSQTYGRMIGLRGVVKAYPDVLAVLDRSLAQGTRSRAANLASPSPTPAPTRASINRNNNAVIFWLSGQVSRAVGLDFPAANDRHDLASLGVIRSAFEVFRRDDLVSDLFAHLQTRAEATNRLERADILLTLGYCRWWNDDKAEAVEAVTRASELEPSIRLVLAEILERQGSLTEALQTVDRIEVTDSSRVMRRENAALRLAVATGNVARARQGAERLFGLRLDAEAQVQLASLMNQLGMHELSEAVLARARKASGNKPASLLVLMNQYQRQQKTDEALQVAIQILRLRPTSATNLGVGAPMSRPGLPAPMNPGLEDESARLEAIQVLARSGKLGDLITRTEAQLERSPNSVPVLQTLIELARIANDKERVRTLSERIARTRPDDARLRIQLANQLIQGGDPAGALDHYRAALQADPAIVANQFPRMMDVYRQAGKMADLAALVETIDLRKLGNSNAVMMVAPTLMSDPQLQEPGFAFFRKGWEAFPLDRPVLINLLSGNDDWWRRPEVYDYARQVVLPAPDLPLARPWAGVDLVQNFGGDGRVVTVANRLLDGATRQNRLGELALEIRRCLTIHPEWSGGRVLLALIAVREGRVEETRDLVRDLVADPKRPIPSTARGMITQDLEDDSRTQDLVDELYEGAVRASRANPVFDPNDASGNQISKLLARYKASGRSAEARDLLLEVARTRRVNPAYDPASLEAQRIFGMSNAAQQLMAMGETVEAVELYREQIVDAWVLAQNPLSSQYLNLEALVEQTQQAIQQAVRTARPDRFARTLAAAIRPGSSPLPPNRAAPAIDLYLSLSQSGFEKDAVVGGMASLLSKAVVDRVLAEEVRSTLNDLVARFPDDLSVAVAGALAAFAEGKPEPIQEATARLIERSERSPLEVLAEGSTRPNARQRAEADRRLGLWLVARECWSRAGMKPQGDRLAALALEAARRNADLRWPLAILREWGQVELDRDDREQGERRWGELRALILARPQDRPVTATASATPRDDFDRALILARMAAERGLTRLSLDTVRQAFRGGSPIGGAIAVDAANLTIGGGGGGAGGVRGFTVNTSANFRTRRLNPVTDGSSEPPTSAIQARVVELVGLWDREGVSALEVYEVLRGVVLPVGRPLEVDLYPLGLGFGTARHPRSLGALLATRAARLGASDELRQAIQARPGGGPIAELAARVLQVQVDLAANRPDRAVAALGGIEAYLSRDTLRVSSELAAHAALPALEFSETDELASRVLDRAIKNLSTGTLVEPASTLLQTLGGHELDRGRLDRGRLRYREYLDIQEKSIAQGQSNPELLNFYRRGLILRVAAAYARRGLAADAAEFLGQYADISPTRYLESSPNGTVAAFARSLARLPAEGRYRLLKDWTLPGSTRPTIRSIVAYLPGDPGPPAVFGTTRAIPPGGVLATALLLIEAAREAGRLDELANEVQALDPTKVDDARALAVLVEIARGRAVEVVSPIQTMIADLQRWNLEAERPGARVVPGVGNLSRVPLLSSLVASSCLRDPRLALEGEALAVKLIARSALAETLNSRSGLTSANGATPNTWMAAHLRRDVLAMKATRASGQEFRWESDPGLEAWRTATSAWGSTWTSPVKPVWVEHEGHVKLLGATPTSMVDLADLALDFPLAGTWEFAADLQASSTDGEGGITFGGPVFAARASSGPARNGMLNNNGPSSLVEVSGSSRAYRSEGFNRVAIQAKEGRVRALVNGILVAEELDPDPTSPWLAVSGKGRVAWRNLTISRAPEIPTEVRLSHADRLGGWRAQTYGESVAPRAVRNLEGTVTAIEPDNFDWASVDGMILGRRVDESAATIHLQSRLAYARPLRDGESVSYRFWFEPGRVEVHPALGRLAFLVQPEGLRLHWMTDGPGLDPSGLASDNGVDDPASRRGGDSVPLRANQWNDARVSLQAGQVAIEINGVVVHQRPMAHEDDRTFSLFHYKDRTSSRVRDVVLRGNWLDRFARASATGLVARTAPPGSEAQARARHALVGESVLTLAAPTVLESSRTLPPVDRYQALAAWVLPGPDHPTFRLQGHFTPLGPAPGPHLTGQARGDLGGMPKSPAFDLVRVAQDLSRLDELSRKVEASLTSSPLDVRGRIGLQAMIDLARGDEEKTVASLEQLKALASTIRPSDPDWMRWPELAAGWSALGFARVRPAALALLEIPGADPGGIRGASDLWVRQVRQARSIGEATARGVAFDDSRNLLPWIPTAPVPDLDRLRGFPRPSWTAIEGVWENRSGPGRDTLMLGIPIRGDFEFSAELSSEPDRDAGLAYAGLSFRLSPDRKALQLRQGDQILPDVPIQPPLKPKETGGWLTWKLIHRTGRVVLTIADRVVLDRPISVEPLPWLAIETPGVLGGAARGVAISGRPVVPSEIPLSHLPDLVGWSSVELPALEVGWRKRGDEIFGRSLASARPGQENSDEISFHHGTLINGRRSQPEPDLVSSSKLESVLRYQSPLVEAGEVEYEFFDDPGKALVHPALGGRAFLLRPDGVTIHRLGDLTPEATDPASRRAPASLPLRPRSWNRMKLAVSGERVSLTLNDVLIFDGPIEAANPRTFGLFTFADEAEARARNVKHRGPWPRDWPGLATPKRD